MDSDYAGTYSRVPSRRDESATPSGRERRGKYRANRREPRTSGKPTRSLIHPDLDPNLCISFKVDAEGNRIDVKVFESKRTQRTHRNTQAQVAEAKAPETSRINHGHDYNS